MQIARSRPPRAGAEIARTPVALVVHRHRIFFWLLLWIVLLLLLSALGQIARYVLGYQSGLGLIDFFYVDQENNLPSWYQSIAFLFAALLLALIAVPKWRNEERFARHWLGLALLFAFLSLDEVGSLHERTIEPLQRLIGVPTGLWAPTWVILGLALVAIVGLVYLRFFFHLAWRERGQVGLAALLLVGGAIGLEMANAALDLGPQIERKKNMTYALMTHIEEGLEMLGLLVFIDFLLARLAASPAMNLRVRG